jgi:hypothetical protein
MKVQNIDISKTAVGNYLVQIWGEDTILDEAEFVSGDDALNWIKKHFGDFV